MKHPYTEFENTALWKAIDVGIAALEKNKDLQLSTAREYVVGSLCQKLVRQKFVTDDSGLKSDLISN
jgi:hypothetical protein